jgi:alkaline phosphatase D
MNKRIVYILVGLIVLVGAQDFLRKRNQNKAPKNKPYLLVISMDGMRHDYIDRCYTPTFDSIEANGARIKQMQPIFPSNTFPNHYTIATGLYAENHGIVNNTFYNKDAKSLYDFKDKATVGNPKMYKGEPIWVSAEAQNVKTATFFWVGSEAKIKGYRPSYWKQYSDAYSNTQKIDTVIHWLQLPKKERPHFITCYFDQPDKAGHSFGPGAPVVDSIVKNYDKVLKTLFQHINLLPIKDSLNVIVLSDHGMTATEGKKTVEFTNEITDLCETIIGGNPFLMLEAKDGNKEKLQKALLKLKGIHAWKSSAIPDSLHLNIPNRLLDFVVIADTAHTLALPQHGETLAGAHGYFPQYSDMQTVFYGIGPGFKTGYSQQKGHLVDLYNLFAQLLEITPAPNNGKPERINKVLRKTVN